MSSRLAKIVVEDGLISQALLDQALLTSKNTKISLVATLVHDFGVDEIALMVSLRKHLRIRSLDPSNIELDSDALRELSRADCKRLCAVPISLQLYGASPKILGVAMADPGCTKSILELEKLSHCTVEPVLVTLSAVEEMIETAYKHAVTEIMPRRLVERGQVPGAASGSRAKISRVDDTTNPPTIPFHHIGEESNPNLALEALLGLCIEKGVFSAQEYQAFLRQLLAKK